MIKRTIEISGFDTRLSLKNRQVIVRRGREVIGSVPAEDIGLLIVDTPDAGYTHGTLTAILEAGGVVVLAGRNHTPAGIILPVAGNSLQTERMRAQADAELPLRKRLWAQLIKAKISRQAKVLGKNSPVRKRLAALARRVRSGDPDNLEGQAARIYWTELFGKGFQRSREGPPPNNLLNYGYMALRAAIARAVCGTGLSPSLGLHHHNRYNPLCLADDLLEPFRALVDARVRKLHAEGVSELDKNSKRELLELLTATVKLREQSGPLLVAFERMTTSLCRCYLGQAKTIEIPQY